MAIVTRSTRCTACTPVGGPSACIAGVVPEVVDSAVQDAFVAVWKGAKKYKRKGEVGGWIWGIASASSD